MFKRCMADVIQRFSFLSIPGRLFENRKYTFDYC